MSETPFQNPRGGYFNMDNRGRMIPTRTRHNPDNVHMGERYYARQGPIGNPRQGWQSDLIKGMPTGTENMIKLKEWEDSQIQPESVYPLGNRTANYSQDKRIYDDWIVDDYLNQGIVTPDEVFDYSPGYKQVVPQLMGEQLAMAKKKKGPLATVPGKWVTPGTPEHSGLSNDMFKDDPLRSYHSGYRYNAHGLQPLKFG